MILRHLRYFVTIADEGSVARAATKLRVAQPALSRQVRSLELDVGTPLFERVRHGVVLTPAGIVLLDGTRTLLAQVRRAFRRAQLAHDGELGVRRIGLGRVATNSRQIGRALAELRDQFPNIELIVNEVPNFAQVRSLRAREIDLSVGIKGDDVESAIDHEVLYDDFVDRALLPAAHPLASAQSIEPRQLAGETLAMMRPALAPGFSQLFAALKDMGLSWQEYESPETVYNLVAAGRAWTTQIGSMHPTPQGTVAVPLKGLCVPVSVVVRWNSDDTSRLTSNVVWVLRTRTDRSASRSGTSKRRELPRRAERHTDRELPDVELRQLRSFVVTVDEGLLSRAAPRLGITQSGLSRQIRALERACGCQLLHRAANGISATAAGDMFRAEASTVLQLADELLTRTQHVERGIASRCRIGAVPSELSGGLLVGALRQLGKRSPEIAVEVTEILTSRQIPALRDGEIDVGLAGAYPGLLDDPSIDSLQLSEDAVDCVLVSASHPLASRASVNASELAKEPFLFIPRESYPKLYDTVIKSFEDIGLMPLISGSFDGPRAVWRLAADGMGWTLGNRTLRANPPPGVVAVPVEGLHIPAGILLLWRRDEQDAGVHTVLDAFRRAS